MIADHVCIFENQDTAGIGVCLECRRFEPTRFIRAYQLWTPMESIWINLEWPWS